MHASLLSCRVSSAPAGASARMRERARACGCEPWAARACPAAGAAQGSHIQSSCVVRHSRRRTRCRQLLRRAVVHAAPCKLRDVQQPNVSRWLAVCAYAATQQQLVGRALAEAGAAARRRPGCAWRVRCGGQHCTAGRAARAGDWCCGWRTCTDWWCEIVCQAGHSKGLVAADQQADAALGAGLPQQRPAPTMVEHQHLVGGNLGVVSPRHHAAADDGARAACRRRCRFARLRGVTAQLKGLPVGHLRRRTASRRWVLVWLGEALPAQALVPSRRQQQAALLQTLTSIC